MAEKVLSDVCNRLAQHTRPNKDFLVKMLRQAASSLSELEQNPLLGPTIKPLSDYVLKHNMLQHKDRDVRLLFAICFSEIIRILAPEPPFNDNDFREIFKLIISVFAELADTTSPYFSRRVKILETMGKVKCCVLMLDIGCDDLVLEMFNTFFSVVREYHQQSLIDAILSVMTVILNEKVSQPLLDVVLHNLLTDGKNTSPASSQLATSVLQSCSEKLEPYICGFLTSCILDRDAVQSELKGFYHDGIFKIFQCAPEMLRGVIPNLTQELLADQVDVRKKAVNLIGKLFALPKHHVAQEYHRLFIEFMKRFCDKSAEVRVSALQCAKAIYTANPSGAELDDVLGAVCSRLLDFDDSVRMQAVIVACDIAMSNLEFVPPKLLSEASKRLRDKKVSVRKKALQKLLEVYRDYCVKCSEGYMTVSEHFEQIPCRILMLCYDKDCKEFRPQKMELVYADDLFPLPLSFEERTKHWISMFLLFDALHIKVLKSILCQKQRFRAALQIYLTLRKEDKEGTSEEVQRRIKASFIKMSGFFPDPSKAEECFCKLNQLKDAHTFDTLLQFLYEVRIADARIIREKFLKKIGDRHPHSEFLQLLSAKCLFNIFSSEHVSCILDFISSSRYGNKHLQASAVDLLLAIISIFPTLLKGSEMQFQKILMEEDNLFNEKLIQVLAKAGPHVSIKLCDIYSFLERVCLEGTRAQSKCAVSAIAALSTVSEQSVFSKLCKALVSSLRSPNNGQNVPSILQSLGCIGQYSVSTLGSWDREIRTCIKQTIFQLESSNDLASSDETSEPCNTCKLKIYGLKTLVKSFVPQQGTHVGHQTDELLDLLFKMLQKGDMKDYTFSCEREEAHIRLVAAKSVLRLSRNWDLHILPELFRITVLMAKDSASSVRKLFLDKTRKLLKEHVIPKRYACAFALAASEYLNDLDDDPCTYIAEFIKEYGREAQTRQCSTTQEGSITDYPVYIVVFLIYVLAHDTGFPSENCKDERLYARFCSPLFFIILALVDSSIVDGDKDLVSEAVSNLLSIFRAIRKAEDAVDVHITPKLHILADIGISTLNALDPGGISSSHAHSLIFLPSSLYRGFAHKNEEVNLGHPARSTSDKYFVKKVIHNFKSNIYLPSSSVPKHGQKAQGDNLCPEAIKYNILNLASRLQVDLSTEGMKEDKKSYLHGKEAKNSIGQEIVSRAGRKRAVSPSFPGSVKLRNNCSTSSGYKSSVTGDTKQNTGKELVTSCDSVTTTQSLMESQVLTQNVGILGSENDGARNHGSVIYKHYKFPSAKSNDCSCSKWQITHDDDSGEVELLCLTSESWETISEDSFAEKSCKENKLAMESNAFHSRHEKKKNRDVSMGTSASEVVSINEDANVRTRRRKI